ncbi:hypothetical protein L6R53_04335 [Myxococcota bacterium]|nr:hypothetical protein [Myxococcota bacterium]
MQQAQAQGPDQRTTPPWLRLPGLALLGLLAVYEGVAMRYALAPVEDWPQWLVDHPYSLWPATWKMFTERDRRHLDLAARVRRDGAWQEVDLHALFPARWESGPRYVRKPFWREAKNRNTLAQAVCRRSRPRPDGVELWKVEWPKTLGQVEQPAREAERTLLLRWDCDDHQPLPTGRRL